MSNNNVFKNIPSVNELLETTALKDLVEKVSHNAVVGEVRSFLEQLRQDVTAKAEDIEIPPIPSASEIADKVASWISKSEQTKLRPVINATGILLHTGLGRSPLAKQAVEAMASIAGNYATVEIDADSGQRGQRIQVVEKLLQEITGAEAAAIVNNNAGATLLTLAAIGAGREIIVSRGQLIEIGGSYRLPEVMSAGGAILREVGTTNKTRASDFRDACCDETTALMRVHTSNYKVVGFTEEPTVEELVAVAKEKNVVMIDDIGSGALHDLSEYGLSDEPVAKESISAGADLVLFSGDKLLGGPQCGIVVGKKKFIDRIIKHPLMRALRVDKTTLAGLTATLKLHRDKAKAISNIPVMQMLATSEINLQGRAERLAPQLAECSVVKDAKSIPSQSQLGGGSVPAQDIATWCVAITPTGISVDALARQLRLGTPSVFGRVQRDRLLLDLRTVLPHQEAGLIEAIGTVKGEDPNDDLDSTAATTAAAADEPAAGNSET